MYHLISLGAFGHHQIWCLHHNKFLSLMQHILCNPSHVLARMLVVLVQRSTLCNYVHIICHLGCYTSVVFASSQWPTGGPHLIEEVVSKK